MFMGSIHLLWKDDCLVEREIRVNDDAKNRILEEIIDQAA